MSLHKEPCICMVLWQINSARVAGVHTPAKASVWEACCRYSGVTNMS